MNIMNKIFKFYKEKRLFLKISYYISIYITSLVSILFYRKKYKIKIIVPKYKIPTKDSLEEKTVNRIFAALKKMKIKEKKVDKIFRPSSMWEEKLKNSYRDINKALEENDLYLFHSFLYNFGISNNWLGLDHPFMSKKKLNSFVYKNYARNFIIDKQIQNWQWFYNNRKKMNELNCPNYGNQIGAYVEDIFISAGSFWSEIYSSILYQPIKEFNRPVIADLGSGYGIVPYFIIKKFNKLCFVDFDLPEVLSIASYYLMKSFPNKKTLLYGEENFTTQSISNYEMIFLPSFEIEKLKEDSIDLFINKNSLGEINIDAAKLFIKHITKSTNYFFHMNHDNYPYQFSDNSKILLSNEYPIDDKKFRLLFRYPDLGHFSPSGFYNYDNDIFLYLYQKK